MGLEDRDLSLPALGPGNYLRGYVKLQASILQACETKSEALHQKEQA